MFYSHPEAISWCSDIFIASFCGRIPELSGTAHRLVYYRMPPRQPQPGNTSLLDPFPHGDLHPSLPAQLLSAPAQNFQSVPCRQRARLRCLDLIGTGAAPGAEPGDLVTVPVVALNPVDSPWWQQLVLVTPGGSLPSSSGLFAPFKVGEGTPMTLQKCTWKVTESAATDTEAQCPVPDSISRTAGR